MTTARSRRRAPWADARFLIGIALVIASVVGVWLVVNGARQIFRNIILPGIGVVCTVLLWAYLSAESTRYGIIWFVIGVVVLLWVTRMLRRPMTINLGEEPAAVEESTQAGE